MGESATTRGFVYQNSNMAVKAVKKTQNPKKTQPAKKSPVKETVAKKATTKETIAKKVTAKEVGKKIPTKKTPTKKAQKATKTVKADINEDVQLKITEASETPIDSVTNLQPETEVATQEPQSKPKRLEDVVGSENITTKCELAEEQVVKAVSAAFKAYEVSKTKAETEKLFDDEPEPINLLVSAIKIPQGEPAFFSSKLPNSFLSKDNDICLIVKDLEKGWKKDHEPTIHHFKEYLDKKNINFVNEILPLRQLRVEYKPFEARGKLSKLYDVVLVDKRVLKFVPRYLGKSFYQSGRFPVSLDLHAKDLPSEFDRALSTSLMSITNKGSSYQIQVGLSNQSEKDIEQNIAAVYSSLLKDFPGTFANVRSLALRFGTQSWTVPIYISCANQDLITMPPPRTNSEPLVDELTTLQPGFKVAVYPSGQVNVVEDENYKPGPLDRQDKPKKKKTKKAAKKEAKAKSIEDLAMGDDSEAEDSNDEEEVAAVVGDDDDEDEVKKVAKAKKKSKAEDSSEDEGDALEDEYMKELELMEGEEESANKVNAEDDANNADDADENEEEAPPAKRSKVQKVIKKQAKKKSKKAVKSNA